ARNPPAPALRERFASTTGRRLFSLRCSSRRPWRGWRAPAVELRSADRRDESCETRRRCPADYWGKPARALDSRLNRPDRAAENPRSARQRPPIQNSPAWDPVPSIWHPGKADWASLHRARPAPASLALEL